MTIMQLVAEQGGREVTIKLIDATILQESDQRKVRGVFRDFVGNRDKRVFTWETVTNDFYVSSSFCYYCCKECFRKGLPNRLGIGSTDSC
jgi:hypothetical protein